VPLTEAFEHGAAGIRDVNPSRFGRIVSDLFRRHRLLTQGHHGVYLSKFCTKRCGVKGPGASQRDTQTGSALLFVIAFISIDGDCDA